MERAASADVEVFEETLDAKMRIQEALMLGLRTLEGVDLKALGERVGADPLAPRRDAIERRRARGDVTLEGSVLRIPQSRWLMLDGIITDLF